MYLNPLYERITKINKGWSNDDKYLVSYHSKRYLLRISSIKSHSKVIKMFDFMNKVNDLSIPICKPVDYMIKNDEIHALYTYIDGHDLVDVLSDYSKEKQYFLGFLSGKYLQKIHTIDIEEPSNLWSIKFNQKIDSKIKQFKESQLKVLEINDFIEYVDKHRHLLLNRPQCFHHGDYHIGNFMMDNHQNLIIIDFEKFDFGDPWEEFNRIVWSAQKSHEFASGMINGYFNDNVPHHFWKLLLLYISNNTISSLPWGLAISEEEYQVMLNQMHEILEWYDHFDRIIPKWYKTSHI